MLLSSVRQVAGTVSTSPQITLYMNIGADRNAANEVRGRLERHAGVSQVQFLAREETLARMKSSPGLRDVIEVLSGNPFPDALVVVARDDSPDAMDKLAGEFRKFAGVEHVQLDTVWVKRLDALVKLGRTTLLLLALLLGAGLIAITFGIIRMQVLTQRAEIEVSRLLGATEAFIRRPFLYHGLLLGVGGGITAWLLVGGAALWLRAPMAELAGLYELTLALKPLSPADSAGLLAAAGSLGWLGAVFSLRQNLGNE